MIRGVFDAPLTASQLRYKNQEKTRTYYDEMRTATGSLQESNKRVKDQVTKYREIARFNKKISTSYYENLKVVIDISKLLHMHVQMFEDLKRSVDSMQEALGEPIQIADFSYLGHLTKRSLGKLSDDFFKSTDDLRKIYEKFGDTDKAAGISDMQQQFSSLPRETGRVIRSLRQV